MGIGKGGNITPDLIRCDPADLSVQPQNPFPGELIPRIDENPQVTRYILDMGLLKETDARSGSRRGFPAGSAPSGSPSSGSGRGR